MREYVVCCTRRGDHGRVELARLVREGDEVREVRLRQRPAPWNKGDTFATEDGTDPAPARYVDAAPSARVDHEGEERWRWRCPRCRLDKPLSGVNLRAWMDAAASGVLDVSMLPR